MEVPQLQKNDAQRGSGEVPGEPGDAERSNLKRRGDKREQTLKTIGFFGFRKSPRVSPGASRGPVRAAFLMYLWCLFLCSFGCFVFKDFGKHSGLILVPFLFPKPTTESLGREKVDLRF